MILKNVVTTFDIYRRYLGGSVNYNLVETHTLSLPAIMQCAVEEKMYLEEDRWSSILKIN